MNELYDDKIKNTLEISTLARQLTPQHQAYVLNTINALLFSQQIEDESKKKIKHEDKSA